MTALIRSLRGNSLVTTSLYGAAPPGASTVVVTRCTSRKPYDESGCLTTFSFTTPDALEDHVIRITPDKAYAMASAYNATLNKYVAFVNLTTGVTTSVDVATVPSGSEAVASSSNAWQAV